MKKAKNRFSTQSLVDRLGKSFAPSAMSKTPQKKSAETTSTGQTPKKQSANVVSANKLPQKRAAEIGTINVNIEKTTVQPNTFQATPSKPVPTVGPLATTPIKSPATIGTIEQTPTKQSATVDKLANTPLKQSATVNSLEQTPTKQSAEVAKLVETPTKQSAEVSLSVGTPTKQSAEISKLVETPIKQSAEVSLSVGTPTKQSADVAKLVETPTKQSAEVSALAATPTKQSAEVSGLVNTPNKPTAEISALGETPIKQSAEVSGLINTPNKTTAELSAIGQTPEKLTADVVASINTPEKPSAEVSAAINTPEKQSADVISSQPTPEKATPQLGTTVGTEKTTVNVSPLQPTPEKTTPNISAAPATPNKTMPDLGTTVGIEKTMPEVIPFAPTIAKTSPDVTASQPTPEKSTAVLVTTLGIDKLAPDVTPPPATPEKTTATLMVRDGFANIDQNGFITGKASGLGLLTDFTGITGLPTSGQYEHTGKQGLGTLATRNGILDIDATGFTPDQKHLGDSDFIGIDGSPGNMTYSIPSGPSPRASYRYNKEMQPKITGAPQTFTTSTGFIITGVGPSGTLTNDGIDTTRNTISSGKSQLLEQYNKFDLRAEAFHRFDGFTSDLGQPYINSKVIANDNVAARSFKGQDGLVRGGIVTRIVRTFNDTLRIGKFLISPTGLLFIAKNVGMQLTNPKVETAAGIDGGGFFARTTRIYPLGLSTLAQIVADVAPVGTLGLIRHGLGPFEPETNYYENVVTETGNLGRADMKKNPAMPTANRLVQLHTQMEVGLANDGTSNLNILADPKAALGSILGGAGGALGGFLDSNIVGQAIDKSGILEGFIPGVTPGSEIPLLSGIMGPNSIYGIGRTDIRRTTSGIRIEAHTEANGTWGQSTLVQATHDKGIGTFTGQKIEDTNKGIKTNPNNATMVSSPMAPYSNAINSKENNNSIHTAGDMSAANHNDIETFERPGITPNGNTYRSEQPYAQGQRTGDDTAPAGQSNRDKIVKDRFPMTDESDLIVDNTKREVLDSSRIASILDTHKLDTTPAGLINYNDLAEGKTEQAVHNLVEKDSAEPYGPSSGQLANYEVYAYGDIPSDQLGHTQIRDFRSDLANGNKTFQQDQEGYSAAKREVAFGQSYGERGIDRSDREATLKDKTGTEIGDKILMKVLDGADAYSPNEMNEKDVTGADADLVRLVIAGVQFRAYISSFTHNIKPEFQNIEYVGRLTDVKLMSKFSVDFSLDFKVAALTARELQAMYFKLNRLSQNCAPEYDGGKPKGPLNRITVGDYFKHAVCFINSVAYSMNEQSPWDIDPGRQLPYYVDVSISGDMITSQYDGLLNRNSDFFAAVTTDASQNTTWNEGARAI